MDTFLTIFLSEVIGTFFLIVIGCGVNAGVSLKKSKAEDSGWIVITIGWAMAVLIGATIALASGGHLNPAVTIAQFAAGIIPISQTLFYLVAELLGAFLGAIVIIGLYWDHFKETTNPDAVGGTFFTGPAIENKARNVITEIVGTFVLVMAVFATIFYGGTATDDGSFHGVYTLYGPLFVGLTVLAIGVSFGGLTGYAINPARDLMPRLAHFLMPIPNKGSSNWGYAWVPIIGPIIGGLFATAVFIGVIALTTPDQLNNMNDYAAVKWDNFGEWNSIFTN